MKLSVKDSLEQVYVMTDGEDKIITYERKRSIFTEAEKWNQRSERNENTGMSGKYSNIKVVSFDMDGTILNTEADLEAAARRALKLAGLPPMPPVRFANYIGNGVKGIYRDLCPDATQKKLEEAVRYQLEWYPEHCTEQTCFYPGMWETLQWMAAKGIRLVIVTNKVETTAKKLANHFCSDLPFEEVWGNDQIAP